MSCHDNLDLPLLSLGSDYKVEHYMLRLTCDIEQRYFSGDVYVFIKQVGSGSTLILDLKDLHIGAVEEVNANEEEVSTLLDSFDKRKSNELFMYWTSKKERQTLDPHFESWCVKVENLQKKKAVLCFSYRTKPEGSSISWVLDDDGKCCCLTTGSLVNNRSLFPYQDAPTLMATWQLLLQVPDGFGAATTGDDRGFSTGMGIYFYTSMLLPLSTFALAIGKWKREEIPFHLELRTPDDRIIECRHPHYPCPFAQSDFGGPKIPCQVFYSNSCDPSLFKDYIPSSIEAIFHILGRHVVPKLDFVIMPSSVTCLGFASPGLILISPSILYGHSPMLARLGHEISHSWFGINIGPKNWNEEWISEGFATFMEDVVDLKMSKFARRTELMELKAINRYQILKSDCQNVDPFLQSVSSLNSETNVVINGLHRDKTVSQIPYLKGYFFLVQLVKIVGLDPLLVALKCYIEHFHGCLITTTECVDFFCHQFQQKEEIRHQAQIWLYSSSLPEWKTEFSTINILDAQVTQHLEYWKRPRGSPPSFPFSQAMPDQVLALLDRLLELESKLIPAKSVHRLIDHYEPHLINADTYHRACELIVAQQCIRFLPMVREFLLQHPAMGAYLYGELVHTNRPRFQVVARETYLQLESKLDTNFKTIIRDLIF